MRVLVLGATGMLGHVMFRELGSCHEVWGSLRSASGRRFFPREDHARLVDDIDVLEQDALAGLIDRVEPVVVVNCVGLIKQLAESGDPLAVLPINAMLPHQLAKLCRATGARLIHISTDCVFSGRRGGYSESDPSDAEDLYGKSKFIGEVHDQSHVVTLRTSIIGHELQSCHSLLDWFLTQRGPVRGYARALFSGLPSVELASVVRDFVLGRPELHGLYHVSAPPISKLDLLTLIARVYGKAIQIIPENSVVLDRSLSSQRFTDATGYVSPAWPALIALMHAHRDFPRETPRHV